MWITSATVIENINIELAISQLMDAASFKDSIIAEGVETAGHLLPPHETQAAAMAAFGPGVVFKRSWDLESSAQRLADFINNHPSKQIVVVVEG